MTGSLKKGLMAGLGAFGGASMAPGIMGASSAAPTAAANVVGNTAQNMGALYQGGAGAATNAGAALGTAQNMGALNQNAALAPITNTAQNMGPLYQGVGVPPTSAVQTATTPVVGQGGAPSVLNQFGSGLKNIITNQGGAGSRFIDENKSSLLSTGISALMTPEEKEEERKKKEEAYVFNRWPSNYSRQEMSVRPAGSTSERTYFAADGGMVPGPREGGTVEQMSQMNSVGDNTRYPMASQTTPTYAAPAERPISQNVIYPATDAAVGSYTGMASGGIASLAAFAPGGSVGFKSKLKAVPEPKKTNKAYQPTGLQDIGKLDKNINSLKKYDNFDDAQGKVNDIQDKLKNLDPKAKSFKSESKALNSQLSAAKGALGNAQKYRTAVEAKEKAISANDAAKAAADQRYETAFNAYKTYKSDYDKEKSDWESQTKRTTSGVTARGTYAKGASGSETAADLQARIDYINKNPEGSGGMGSTYLTNAQKELDDIPEEIRQGVAVASTLALDTKTNNVALGLKSAELLPEKKAVVSVPLLQNVDIVKNMTTGLKNLKKKVSNNV
jgi:hypothetical protein